VIFLSYTWRDHGAARAVDWQLRLAGFDVWIDHRNLRLDADILAQVDRAIQCCELFVTMHPGRQSSPWMRAEETIARAYGKTIVPFLADPQAFACHVSTISRSRAVAGLAQPPFSNPSAPQMRGIEAAS
jgi:hypothetical protein